jgi:hypothetical protein
MAASRAATATAAFVLLLALLLCTGTSPVTAAVDCTAACVEPCKSFAQGICSTGASSGTCPPDAVATCQRAAILACGLSCFTGCSAGTFVPCAWECMHAGFHIVLVIFLQKIKQPLSPYLAVGEEACMHHNPCFISLFFSYYIPSRWTSLQVCPLRLLSVFMILL